MPHSGEDLEAECVGEEHLAHSNQRCQHEVLEVSSISVATHINGYQTDAVVDSAAMVTLIQEKRFLFYLQTGRKWSNLE